MLGGNDNLFAEGTNVADAGVAEKLKPPILGADLSAELVAGSNEKEGAVKLACATVGPVDVAIGAAALLKLLFIPLVIVKDVFNLLTSAGAELTTGFVSGLLKLRLLDTEPATSAAFGVSSTLVVLAGIALVAGRLNTELVVAVLNVTDVAVERTGEIVVALFVISGKSVLASGSSISYSVSPTKQLSICDNLVLCACSRFSFEN